MSESRLFEFLCLQLILTFVLDAFREEGHRANIKLVCIIEDAGAVLLFARLGRNELAATQVHRRDLVDHAVAV